MVPLLKDWTQPWLPSMFTDKKEDGPLKDWTQSWLPSMFADKKENGPFVKGLDTALVSFNVHRQAYYSGTFVGNHVHRTLM